MSLKTIYAAILFYTVNIMYSCQPIWAIQCNSLLFQNNSRIGTTVVSHSLVTDYRDGIDVSRGSFRIRPADEVEATLLDLGQNIQLPPKGALVYKASDSSQNYTAQKLFEFPIKHRVSFPDIKEMASISMFCSKCATDVAIEMTITFSDTDGRLFTLKQTQDATRSYDWLNFNLANFAAKDQGNETSPFDVFDNTLTFNEISLKIINNSNEPTDLKISDTISFDFNIPNTSKVSDLIRLEGYYDNYPIVTASGKVVNSVLLLESIDSFFDSMKAKESQDWAKRVILSGRDNLEHELNQLGFKADREFTGSVVMGIIMTSLKSSQIPIETGDFAIAHGAFSHHAQILAGFHLLPPEHHEVVHAFLTKFIAHRTSSSNRYFVEQFRPIPVPSSNWGLWNFLFDSRTGNSVHTSTFWRDFLNEL